MEGRRDDLQAAQEEDAHQLYLPIPFHVQSPDQRQREQDGKDIRDNIDGARYAGRQKDIDARALNLGIPSFVHGHALENGEEDFGDVVGQDHKGKAPEDDGEAGNDAEDTVEEEKGGVFEGGRPNAVEHFHGYDGLSGVRSRGMFLGIIPNLKGRFRR